MYTFDKYERMRASTAVYPDSRAPGEYPEPRHLVYPVLGLCGESGEIAEKVKKWIRDGRTVDEVRSLLILELGDVLWYLSACAYELDTDLETVARANVEKLQRRKTEDKIHGSGDLR